MTDTKTPKSSYEKMAEEDTNASDNVTTDNIKKTDAEPAAASDTFKPASHQAQLEEKIQQLEEKCKSQEKELKEIKLRNMADINNLQQRYQRESATLKTYAHQYLAKDIIDIADALEQAENSLEGKQKEGIELISTMLTKALEKHQIEAINPTNHEVYDHNFHEAMVMQPSEKIADNHIIQVIQKGYKIKDRLLRAARVIVSKNPESTEENENNK